MLYNFVQENIFIPTPELDKQGFDVLQIIALLQIIVIKYYYTIVIV